MTRANFYRSAKRKASDLGINISELSSLWRRSTKQFWIDENIRYDGLIKRRNTFYQKATNISRRYNIPLNLENTKYGQSLNSWKTEARRILAIAKIKQAEIDEIKEREQRQRLIRNTINKNINNGRFQQVFNDLINRGYKLDLNQIREFWNQLSEDRYEILIEPLGQNIPLNSTTRDFIYSILENGIIESEGESYGSDVLDNIEIQNITEIRLTKIIPDRVINNRDGQFFGYINTTDLDLSRYQVYNQEQAKTDENKNNHCLINSLQLSNIKKSIINEIKLTYIKGFNIRKSDLKDISNIIEKNINLYSIINNKIRKQVFNKNFNEDIDIAIYENHYFIYEKTDYSRYSIINYNDIKHLENFNDIIEKNGKYYKKSKDRKINSLVLIDMLFKKSVFKKLDISKFNETASNINFRDHIYLDNIENEQKPFFNKSYEIYLSDDEDDEDDESYNKGPKPIFYADCETFVNTGKHELYLLGCVNSDNDNTTIYNSCKFIDNQELINNWLSDITKNIDIKKKIVVYFHNLKYDYTILEKYLNIKSRVEKDGSLYRVRILYEKYIIELRDSYKLLPIPLGKFGKQFDLPQEFRKKEAIAYRYYTKENNNKRIDINDYKELLSYEERMLFDNRINKEPSYDKEDKTFNPLSYYKDYLRLDCLTLKKGLEKFNSLILGITDKKCNIYDYLSISSLTDNYMTKEGVYNGIYEVKGNLRAYIAKAVYGGRVCVNQKYKKQVIEGKISDYDGVSFYASAINRLCREVGLPKGKARRFDKSDLQNWKNMAYSILTVKITKVNKIQQMPFIAEKSNDSINYINEPPKENIIIDCITLQDYIKFHDIEYELLDGVYWNGFTNKRMGEVIKKLFDARLKAKKEEKMSLSEVLKLMLNSAYGKTIMKKSPSKKVIIKSRGFNNYIYNNFNTIKSFRKLNDHNYEVNRIQADNTYNRGHIGTAILSYSKRIMNEVFDIANDNNLPIYYTDTDSLHCNLLDIPKLEEKYKEVYGKELNGANLEQFHTDFKLSGAESEIYANKSIFLGKKSYLDCLESTDEKGDKITGFHIRLKGITKEGLEHEAKKYNNSYLGLYEDLSKGMTKQITLNPFNPDLNKEKVLFDFKKGEVSTKSEFIRKVRF